MRAIRRSSLVSILVVLLLSAFFCGRTGALLLLSILRYGALPYSSAGASQPEAIVLLAADYSRIRRSAQLHDRTGLPVLVTGGRINERFVSEAAWMAHELKKNFNTPVRWVEDKAQTTEENARYSAALLKRSGIRHVLLVTDDRHMLRARLLFGQYCIHAIPAPVKYAVQLENMRFAARDLFPSRLGWRLTRSILHEIGGIAWIYLGRLLR